MLPYPQPCLPEILLPRRANLNYNPMEPSMTFVGFSYPLELALRPSCLLLQKSVTVLLLSQLYYPTNSIVECFAGKNFIILHDIHRSPLGEV